MRESLIERESHLSDATVNVLPIKPHRVYAVSDSRLNLRKATAKGGNQGPEIATTEKLKFSASRRRSTANFSSKKDVFGD